MESGDPSDIIGLHRLVNGDIVNKKLDLKNIETQISNIKPEVSKTKEDPKDIMNNDFLQLLTSSGLDVGEFDYGKKKKSVASSVSNFSIGKTQKKVPKFKAQSSSSGSSFSQASKATSSSRSKSSRRSSSSESSSVTSSCTSSSGSSDTSSSDSESSSSQESSDASSSTSGRKSRRRVSKHSQWNKQHSVGISENIKARDEERDNINRALTTLTHGVEVQDSVDSIKRHDWRIATITNITQMRSALEEDLNPELLRRIPQVDYESPDNLIRNVHDALLYIQTRKDNYALAETVADAVATKVGDYFDGTRNVFGVKPNLTGWNKTVTKTLSRSQYQASEAVESVIKHYGIGSGMQLMFHLAVGAYSLHKYNSAKGPKPSVNPESQEVYKQLSEF